LFGTVLRTLLMLSPERFGYHATHWTVPLLQDQLNILTKSATHSHDNAASRSHSNSATDSHFKTATGSRRKSAIM
jgi:hypothetical protein